MYIPSQLEWICRKDKDKDLDIVFWIRKNEYRLGNRLCQPNVQGDEDKAVRLYGDHVFMSKTSYV